MAVGAVEKEEAGDVTESARWRPRFFREYWAEKEQQRNNCRDRLLRVNDPDVSLHERLGQRPEARANGLLLIDAPEDLFGLDTAELYLELWGGHPKTAEKRFVLNGGGLYPLPEVGTAAGACTYSYPVIQLRAGDLVSGVNAFQFSCERGGGFWGHFIVDNACVRAYLRSDHEGLRRAGLDGFQATVNAPTVLDDEVQITLELPERFSEAIESVDFYARYRGFDDDGDGREDDWHGFTHRRRPLNHVGSAHAAPFAVTWNTRMIPTQGQPMALAAEVHLRDGFHYVTPDTGGLTFPDRRPRVELFGCREMPRPFWSRAGKQMRATIELPDDLSSVESAQLVVKVWDGGEGTVEEPFRINGHPYTVLSGRGVHDVVFTQRKVSVDHLRPGMNELALLSDTEHHGVEVLLPGPCLVLRFGE